MYAVRSDSKVRSPGYTPLRGDTAEDLFEEVRIPTSDQGSRNARSFTFVNPISAAGATNVFSGHRGVSAHHKLSARVQGTLGVPKGSL